MEINQSSTKDVKCNVLAFPPRGSLEEFEEGHQLQPKFDAKGIIPCITQDAETLEVLMLGYMNQDALSKSIQTGLAHYYSRSRQKLWKKGEESGLFQHIQSLLIDDDQDCVLLKVKVDGGASCHVGYRSCFFRQLTNCSAKTDFHLTFLEKEKVFNPQKVYKHNHSS